MVKISLKRVGIGKIGSKVYISKWECQGHEPSQGDRARGRIAWQTVRSAAGDGTQVTDVRDRRDRDPRWGFSGPRDFLMAALESSDAKSRDQVEDDRLKPLAIVDDDKKAHGQLAYLLPRAFNPSFLGTAGSDEQTGGSGPPRGLAAGGPPPPGA